ncbi:protein NUCLEAR FUSION DEFECTIVE 6, mitochondrial isoform X2 [Malania oleifera]|uniref:protein NUCLEAR FUSION DEFECTIVE 6, mitochondrial isoform X2 n=1 Tax=Malania oleifera TaxID=397392 RepID=UPI0025AE0FF6|nr:protein NUCLEAR FUSION DEFECTIVE 6, mitochondrial isoform X2 [Malania oleifera]
MVKSLIMAARCARRTLRLPSTVLSVFCRPSSLASGGTKLGPSSSAKPISASRSSHQKLAFSRLPIELGGAQSLMPLHSVTASALFTSLLSLSTNKWGCLSAGSFCGGQQLRRLLV